VKFESGAAGVIEASRICAGRVFGIFWEIAGTQGTIYNSGERFNELQVFRMGEEKRDRGFKTVFLISHLAQGIKRSLRLWMSRPVPVPGSPLEANSLVP
jgi:predicted dehydrogenase